MRKAYLDLPKGWFAVADSDELAVDSTAALQFFGEELVLWRSADGAVHLMEAFCPHMGAHLAHGGRVEGSMLRCPFHGWAYDDEGLCVDVPYGRVPRKRVGLRSYPVVERNGSVMAWYDEPNTQPKWEVPTVPECNDADFSCESRHRWTIGVAAREMAENLIDVPHFAVLHRTGGLTGWDFTTDRHTCRFEASIAFPGLSGTTMGGIATTQFGLGFSVTRYTGAIEMVQVTSGTAITPGSTELRIAFKWVPDVTRGRRLGDFFARRVLAQLRQDIGIWEHKTYLESPALLAEDGPITRYRRWAEQFATIGRIGDPEAATADFASTHR